MARKDCVWPVRVTVHKDQVVLGGIGAEICTYMYFLKWSGWCWLEGDWLLDVKWGVVLPLLAAKDDIVDIIVYAPPVE